MRIRRTPKELTVFKTVVDYYTGQGYPKHIAESYAWDSIFIDRRVKRGTFRSKAV